MVVTTNGEIQASSMLDYDQEKEFQEHFDNKAGVKGLVDSGVKKIPRIFHHNFKRLEDKPGMFKSQLSVPIIDVSGINQLDATKHLAIVDKLRDASKKWGFFQVVNHGIPISVMDNMITAIRRFHEQDIEKKKKHITLDTRRVFKYNGLPFDRSRLRTPVWNDCVSSSVDPLAPNFGQVPEGFRTPILDYTSHVKTLAVTLFELLSEALGLKTNHLKDVGCADGLFFVGHYYPPCPEPELTLGGTNHTDIAFLNILVQDEIGALQVLHQNEWVDVPPLPGGLVVNFGDMMQASH
ncbi:hypothetical protein ACH5RR_033054 [Cinchona calisaya]|uniref:Fe2OG dioxygenase domain-containing protein n=1 Tax=Cinchona calisaya TaxID=153742 RepID=A0ABD2YJV5_9GENT